MLFDGQIWFDFSSTPVWTFYRWIRQLAESGADVTIEWLPLPKGTERAAMATLLSIDEPQERGRYLHAMLGLVHLEGMAASDLRTVKAAVRAAGLDTTIVKDAHPLLEDLRSRATSLGVDSVPTLYRRGPVMSIHLNQAILNENPWETAETINKVIGCDGIWELRKP